MQLKMHYILEHMILVLHVYMNLNITQMLIRYVLLLM